MAIALKHALSPCAFCVQDNTLIGVSSWGLLGCARPENPGVYQRVAFFAEWIQSITGPLEPQPDPPQPSSGSTRKN